jgi:hypothetical protein
MSSLGDKLSNPDAVAFGLEALDITLTMHPGHVVDLRGVVPVDVQLPCADSR